MASLALSDDCVAASEALRFSCVVSFEAAHFLLLEDRLIPDYEKLYHILFNAITDAIEAMSDGEAKELLIKAQQECEERYIGEEE